MNDIAERLRILIHNEPDLPGMLSDVADEIERLHAENEKLRSERDIDADQIIAMAGSHWVDEQVKRRIGELESALATANAENDR